MAKKPETIDEVISRLGEIVKFHSAENSPLCLFPALYRKVTEAVRDKIKSGNYFEDNERMENLDVMFANRFIDAWEAWRNNQPLSDCWKFAFEAPGKFPLLILQNLVLGMNAHINFDLGIAAFQTGKSSSLHDLKTDFMRINDILGTMMDHVQKQLSWHSPWLGIMDQLGGIRDEKIFEFSMKRARDFSWILANELFSFPERESELIHKRDGFCLTLARKVAKPGFILGIGIRIALFREETDYKKVVLDLA